MKTVLFICAVFLPSVALSSDRVRMSDNSEQTSLKDALTAVSKAVESEDLDLFESCFACDRRDKIRKKYAMVFVRERCSMELIESHTIEVDEDAAEVAVRYKMCVSSKTAEVVSKVRMVKEEGKWLIDRETIVSKKASGDSYASANDTQYQDREPKWDPMNPDRNRVSPNLHHLIGDIGVQPGMGCAGGACANGRCKIR